MSLKTQFIKIAILCFCFTLANPLMSEIQEVKVSWLSASCPPGCDSLLKTQFSKIPAVSAVEMNGPSGQAVLQWKPNAPFSFFPLNAAMRMIGPRLHIVRVKVKGTIKHDNARVKIVSDGDGTEFFLLSPVATANNRYVETHSSFNRGLTQALRNQLLEGEKAKQTAIIEGPIFQPFRSPPIQLIVENLSFEDPSATK